MTFWGKIIKGDKIIRSETCENGEPGMAEALLACIEHFSRSFDMEAPMWHSAHTKQMSIFHRAVFRPDDFIDSVDFDRFEIQIIDKK
jgi:hypothetical protein